MKLWAAQSPPNNNLISSKMGQLTLHSWSHKTGFEMNLSRSVLQLHKVMVWVSSGDPVAIYVAWSLKHTNYTVFREPFSWLMNTVSWITVQFFSPPTVILFSILPFPSPQQRGDFHKTRDTEAMVTKAHQGNWGQTLHWWLCAAEVFCILLVPSCPDVNIPSRAFFPGIQCSKYLGNIAKNWGNII